MVTIQKLGIAQVNNTNLLSQPHANIFNLIDNKVNVPDPRDNLPPQQQSRKMVYTRMPDVSSYKFSGYPFIVVFTSENEPDFYTVDNSKSMNMWTVPIEVYSSDRMRDSNEARGLEFLNNLCDSITKILNDKSNRSILRNLGMANIKPIVVSSDVIENNGELVYFRVYNITFNRLLNTGG